MSLSAGASLDIAFAQGALHVLGVFYSMSGEQAYDFVFEEGRHSLIQLDSALSAQGRLLLRPAIDALTALQVGADAPVGTGVLRSGALGATSYEQWLQLCPQDHVKILRLMPSLLLLCRSGGTLERSVHFLRDLLRRGHEDRGLLLFRSVTSCCVLPSPGSAATSWLSSSGTGCVPPGFSP